MSHSRGQFLVESFGKGMANKHVVFLPQEQYKRQKITTPEDESLSGLGVQYAAGKGQRRVTNSSRR